MENSINECPLCSQGLVTSTIIFDNEGVHFDTNHYPYILWNDYKNLKKKLIGRIESTLPNRFNRELIFTIE